jgi:uncharacterized protein (TIGR02246 family)
MSIKAGFLGVLLLSTSTVLAQTPPAGKSSPAPDGGGPASRSPEQRADARAIGELVDAFIRAYNAKDVKALGALFTQNAEIQDEDGDITRGRDAVIERFVRIFKEEGSGALSVASDSLRFLGTDLAIEEGTATLSEGDGNAPRSNRYSVIYAREGGRWLHARIRDEPSDNASPHERLSELEWMLGEWFNESDDAIVLTTCTWSKDGNFLLRDFDVKVEGRIALSGTQRIGWDGQKNQFRTWVFDTTGGFAEGLMFRDDNRWVIKSTGVRADGSPVSMTNVITVLGKDRMRWESSDRTVGDAPVAETDRFDLVRRAPFPASKLPRKGQNPTP